MFRDKLKFGKIPISRLALIARIGIFLIITILYLGNVTGYTAVDRKFYDNLFLRQHRNDIYDNVITLTIDDKDALELGSETVPNEVYTSLLDGILKDASSVVFTNALQSSTDSNIDSALADAILNHGSVVMPYYKRNATGDNSAPIYPYELFFSSTPYNGFIGYENDTDGYVRQFELFENHKEELYPSIVYSALEASGYTVTPREGKVSVNVSSTNKHISTITVDENNKIYRLPLSSDYKPYASYDLLDVYEGKVPYSAFSGKIVVIGEIFEGSNAVVKTPSYSIHSVNFIAECIIGILNGFDPNLISTTSTLVYVAILYVLVDLLSILLTPNKRIIVPLGFSLFVIVNGALAAAFGQNLISVVFPLIGIWASFIINFLFHVIGSEKATEIHRIPTNSIIQLSNIGTSDSYTFVSYMRVLESSILEPIDISIEHLEIDKRHPLYKEYLSTKTKKHDVLVIDNYIFIPLTSRGKKSIPYSVLRSNGNINLDTIHHIAALILSADVYFKFSDEGKQKERLYQGIIEKMINAVDSKDPTMREHSKNVANTAVSIGKLLMLSDYEIERLRLAAQVHDIGKSAIADNILYKPSFYSEDDIKEIQKHPQLGMEILKDIKLDEYLRAGILYHHESYDGSGYPEGLSGKDIPQVARIIKIADVYDALISERQYKKPLSIEVACNILYEGKGKEYDPEITDIFIESVKPEGWIPPEASFNMPKSLPDGIKVMSTKYHSAYMKHIRQLVDDMPTECEFSFNLSKGFCGLTFGNHFTEKNWLYTKPICISASKNEEEMIYFKQEYTTDRKFTFVFKRGYLTSGMVASTTKIRDMEDYILELHKDLGEPFYSDEIFEAWDTNKFYIVNFFGTPEKSEHLTIYINKFIL